MSLNEKIMNTEVVDMFGGRYKVINIIPGDGISNTYICLSNGKKYSIGITFMNKYFKYEDKLVDLIAKQLTKETEKMRGCNSFAGYTFNNPYVNYVEKTEKLIMERKNKTCEMLKGKEKENKGVKKTDTNVVVMIGNNCIDSFREDNYYLSNMYPCTITYNGLTYESSESAFQAQKDLTRSVEFTTISGKSAKSLGKRVHLRSDWESVKVGIMEEIVRAKFTQNEDLKEKLLSTGDKTLVEGNTWNDRYWGVCKGKGLNQLGNILMKIREELKM